MASYSVAANEYGVRDKVLGASAVDTVTFTNDVSQIEVQGDGSSAIYFTIDGTTPTVSGQNTYAVPAGQRAARHVVSVAVGDVVKLISAGTPTYSVTGFSDDDDHLDLGIFVVTPKYASITASASGDTQIVAAVTGKKIVVVNYTLVANAAVNVKWRSAANDISGLLYLAANGGAAPAGTPQEPLLQTNAGEALQINLSGAQAVGGHLAYYEQA